MEDLVISGVTLDENQARVTLWNVPDEPGYAAKVFRLVGDDNILVDMIVQNVGADGRTHLSFTVPKADAQKAAAVLAPLGPERIRVEPRWPSCRSWAWAFAPTRAWPRACSAPWRKRASTSP